MRQSLGDPLAKNAIIVYYQSHRLPQYIKSFTFTYRPCGDVSLDSLLSLSASAGRRAVLGCDFFVITLFISEGPWPCWFSKESGNNSLASENIAGSLFKLSIAGVSSDGTGEGGVLYILYIYRTSPFPDVSSDPPRGGKCETVRYCPFVPERNRYPGRGSIRV